MGEVAERSEDGEGWIYTLSPALRELSPRESFLRTHLKSLSAFPDKIKNIWYNDKNFSNQPNQIQILRLMGESFQRGLKWKMKLQNM